ncbi:MAG: translocation/assembly module TamB domain-containing protein [Flavobacteriales bacterium]|nr:translocation/assembly module TamB domain-containing protein [Flavobacteriales bacterium]
MISVVILLISLFFITFTKSSRFQTALVQAYLKNLSKQLQTEISVQSVDISFFTGLTINKLFVRDLHNDTLVYIEKLNADIKEFSLQEKNIVIDDVRFENSYFNIRKHKQDSVLNLNFIVNHFASNDTTSSEWNFSLNSVSFKNSKMAYNDDDYLPVSGIDYDHVILSNFDMDLDEIKFIPSGINCMINQLAFKDKSGFEINEMKTEFNISPNGITAQHLKIKTPHSNINGDVNFLTKDYGGLAEFIDSVSINSYFESTKVSFKDICFFSTEMDCFNKTVDFQGEIRGKVNNLRARKIELTLDDGTYFKGNVNITGIPDAENMFMHIKADELLTSKAQLEKFPIYPFKNNEFIQVPDNFKHLGKIRFKGSYTGFYHDFVAYGNFYTDLGRIATDIAMTLKNNKTIYKGSIKTSHFNMGKFLEIPEHIGTASMEVSIDGKEFELKDLEAKLKGKIQQIEVKGYNYQNIDVEGFFANKIFNGKMDISDENIDLDFKGSVDFAGKLPEMKFVSQIHKAKLAQLKLYNDSKLNPNFSMDLKVDMIGNSVDNLLGNINVINLRIKDEIDDIKVKKITIQSEKIGNKKNITVDSDVMVGFLEGNYNFDELIDAGVHNFTKYFPSFQIKHDEHHQIKNDFEFNITALESSLLSKYLFNGVKFAENTVLRGYFNSETQSLSVVGKSSFIDAMGTQLVNASLEGKTTDQKLIIDIGAKKISQSDSLYIENFKSWSVANNDSLLTKIEWQNNDTILKTEGKINLTTVFESPTKLKTKLSDSYLYITDSLWTFNKNNNISLDFTDSLDLRISSLGIYSGEQSLLVDGKITGNPKDQLDIALTNFNLDNIQKIVPKNQLQIEGVVDGVASFKKESKEIIFTSDLTFDKLIINETPLGNGKVKSSWEPSEKNLFLDGKFFKGHLPTIIFNGNYKPFVEDDNLNLSLILQRTDLQVFKNYTNNYLSNMRGVASAELSILGSPSNPKFSGYVTLQKTSFVVNYLNSSFSTPSCQINIQPDMISYDNVLFFDEKGSKAYSNGTVFHDNFKKVSMDIGMQVSNFQVLNTSIKDNELFNGKAIVSGLINVGMYKNKLNVELDLTTEKETVINIPLNTAEEVSESNFIEFVSNEIEEKVEEKVDLSDIELNFSLHATPDAEVRLVFDEKVGDVIRAKGEGELMINITPQGEFKMYGDYIVKDGDYLFTLQNIINKKFNLEEGGKISWNGNPLEAQLNLTATYKLRARLYELLANLEDSSSAEVYKRRTPINLKLNITNTMLSPQIAFDIDLPSADEATKNKVRSILYVSDQNENIQELNKQVFSLLVLNQFIPPDGGGTATYSNVGSTTSMEMLSNQLSNYLSQISSKFDVGFNYRPGDQISSQEVEVALSTQLFNDRVVIDGNLGVSDNKNLSQGQKTSNFAGDFSIEYKITEDGKLRIKAFNQSNQFSLLRRSSNYTQGAGLFYRREFDKFSDLFRKSVAKRKDD